MQKTYKVKLNNYEVIITQDIDGKFIIPFSNSHTALKPSHEPIVLARKPLSEKTVAENVLKWGTGGINIDGSRVEAHDGNTTARKRAEVKDTSAPFGKGYEMGGNGSAQGRFPANLIHDGSDEVVGVFPNTNTHGGGKGSGNKADWNLQSRVVGNHKNDSGSAARFFYCAKSSKSERNGGLEEMPEQITDDGREKSIDNPFLRGETVRHNNHPTVKPIALMKYLVKLITPPQGVVLDPFAGSGSTLCAAVILGFNYIGIDMEEEYVKIAQARVKYWAEKPQQEKLL